MRRRLIRVMLQILAVIGMAEVGQIAAMRALEGMFKPLDALAAPERPGDGQPVSRIASVDSE